MKSSAIMAILLGAALALGACTKPGERVLFEGNYYPVRSKKDGDRRENFVVTVRRVAQGIEGARAAGAYEATSYCVETFGDSTITWKPGSDPNETNVAVEGDTMTMRGSCVSW